MGKTSRRYGYKGSDRDEFGLLPEKEIINLRESVVKSNAPISVIEAMLLDCVKMGETPTIVKYGGTAWTSTHLGLMCKGKYYSLKLENDKSMDSDELELI